MDENERFEQVCKPNFARTDKKLDKVLFLLEGNGKPGLISRLERMEQKCQAASGIIGFVAKNWQTIAIITILVFNTFSAGRKIDPAQITEIAKQVDALKVLAPNDVPKDGS